VTVPARRARVRREPRRGAVLVLLAAALVGLGLASARTPTSTPIATPPSSAVVAEPAAESSASFCAGLEHEPGVTSSTIALANLAGVGRTLEVTSSNDAGRSARRLIGLRPGRVLRLDPAGLLEGGVTAVTVVADGGGVVATESLTGAEGTAVAPCLTSASASSYLTAGSTKGGHSLAVSVYNPTTTVAVATASFSTPTALAVPTKYQGFTVLPRRLVEIVVHDVAPNLTPITTSVTTTSGSVVVYGVSVATKGKASISLQPGAPAPATTAVFPVAPNHVGTRTTLVLANPTATAVAASIATTWSPGCGHHCAAPFAVVVDPGSPTTLQVAPSDRVPLGARAAAMVTTSAPGLVVVERVRTSASVGQSSPLDDPAGRGATHLALVDPTGSGFHQVAITNTGDAPVTVTLETLGGQVRGTVVVAAHGVATVPPGRLTRFHAGALQLLATGPVYAAGTVADALTGSDVLPAVPVSG
jgi:hypothetical protein